MEHSIIVFGVSQMLGLLTFLLVLFGSLQYDNYLDTSHPILMTLSMVYLYGTSITMRSGLKSTKFDSQKLGIAIAAVQGICIVCALVGVILIFKSMNTHLKTFHGIFGLIAVIILILQFLSGTAVYLFPKASLDIRNDAKPYFIGIGLLVFLMGSINAMIQINIFSSFRGSSIVMASGFICFLYILSVLFICFSDKKEEEIED